MFPQPDVISACLFYLCLTLSLRVTHAEIGAYRRSYIRIRALYFGQENALHFREYIDAMFVGLLHFRCENWCAFPNFMNNNNRTNGLHIVLSSGLHGSERRASVKATSVSYYSPHSKSVSPIASPYFEEYRAYFHLYWGLDFHYLRARIPRPLYLHIFGANARQKRFTHDIDTLKGDRIVDISRGSLSLLKMKTLKLPRLLILASIDREESSRMSLSCRAI